MQHKIFLGNGDFLKEHRLRETLAETLSNDPHLTDSDLIELSAGVADQQTAETLQRHLSRCAQCAAELAALQAHSAAWADPAIVQKREARIGRSDILRERLDTPWWGEILTTHWVSITSLRPHLAARAASANTTTIEFPIYGETGVVPDLAGIIQRRDNAYHIRINASPETQALYEGRYVEVVLAESELNEEPLQRKIAVNQFVFLGTDLDITTHKIAARLQP